MEEIIEDKILQKIGNNIKTARQLKGFTQEKLAEQLNKSVNFVSLVERGKSGIGIKTIIDICNILDIEPNSIFGGIVNYENKKDKMIIDSISSLANDDKEIVINLIEYIMEKGSK